MIAAVGTVGEFQINASTLLLLRLLLSMRFESMITDAITYASSFVMHFVCHYYYITFSYGFVAS